MPPLARTTLGLAAATAMVWIAGAFPLVAADRYIAWLDDGTRLTAKAMPTWPIPGVSQRLGDKDLLKSSNPVRLVLDRRANVELAPPYLVLANGDVLTGMPAQLAPDEGRIGVVPRVKVQLESPLMPVSGTGVAVRTDRVRRIVATADADPTEPPPGTVVLADGRRLTARSIRWREYGLAILTETGIIEANFGDLVDVVLPDVDRTAGVLGDNLMATSGGSGVAIARFQMQGGAIITAARVSREVERNRRRNRVTSDAYYYVQPAWSDEPIALPEPLVAWCGYRSADEAPLSQLPAETLANRRLIGRPEAWLANRAAGGGLLASGDRESDLGLLTHSHSEIAFDLPAAARTLELSVGLDRALGGGGCVRCKVVAEKADGEVLWDSGVLLGDGGPLAAQEDSISRSEMPTKCGPLDVAGLARVILITEYAHDDRPEGADPLDIRDRVAWLAPLVTLDLSASGKGERVRALSGMSDWELGGQPPLAEREIQLASRWNLNIQGWEPVLTLPKKAELRLTRAFRVTPAADIVELLTACPLNLAEHEFSLTVNGKAVDFQNNADRDDLREWVSRYGRSRSRDDDERSLLGDRLAYWWDLAPFRGQEVKLELSLRGERDRNEIAWRGLSIRSAIGNLPEGDQPLAPEVQLTSLSPLELRSHRNRPEPMKDAIPSSKSGEPIRFLGQRFRGGYGMRQSSAIAFSLEPEYRKFVAIVGCCNQVAGPLQVLIDDRVVWERTVYSSLTPAEQLEIAIPPGSQTLTLQTAEGINQGHAAWTNAGFMK